MKILRKYDKKVVMIHHEFFSKVMVRIGFFKWPWLSVEYVRPCRVGFIDLKDLCFYFVKKQLSQGKMAQLRLFCFGIAFVISE